MKGQKKICFLLFLISFPAFTFFSNAADLIIASGQTYMVPEGQSQSFNNITVSGILKIGNNATLTVLDQLSLTASSGAKVNLQNATLNVAGNVILGIGNNISLIEGSEMTIGRGIDVTTASIFIDQGSSLVITQIGTFREGSSLIVDRGSKMIVSGSDSDGLGLGFYNSSVAVDNNSSLEISNGYSDVSQGSIGTFVRGGTVIVRKNLFIVNSSVTVTLNGIIEAYGNIINQSSTIVFDTGATLKLPGGNQTVSNVTSFYNLLLLGDGNKNLNATGVHIIKNKLSLGSRILIVNNVLHISSALPDAIERTTGYIQSGPLKRSVDAQSLNKTYLFPVGINGKYRPVQIKPVTVSSGAYIVEYKEPNANSLSSKVDQVLELNNKFYHKIYKEGNAPRADLSVFYDPATESPSIGNFNHIASWNTALLKWEFLGGLTGTTTATSLLGVIAQDVTLSFFNEANPGTTLYVLARAEELPFIPNTYATLKRELDGGFQIAIQDTIRFRFEEEYAVSNANLKYKVYNKYHIPIIAFPNPTLLENSGDNRFKLNVAAVPAGEFATLEVQNQKGETWYMRFKTKEF